MENYKVGDVIELGLILTGGGYRTAQFKIGTLRPVKASSSVNLVEVYSESSGRWLNMVVAKEIKIVARMRIKSLKS